MIIPLFLMNLLFSQTTGSLNFLLIVVDDLRPALGCYGDENAYTPNIDKLAENGVLFERAYAQQSLCAPSRNSFLTSRRPDTLKLYDFYSYWRDTVGNFTTLPQHLKNHGYRTKSIGKIFHPGISSNYSDDNPYSWNEKPYHPKTNRYKNSAVCPCSNGSLLAQNLVCPVSVNLMPGKTLPDMEILKNAKKFIRNYGNDDRPFFMAVGFEKPHIPLKYPREYLKYHPLSKFHIPQPYDWPKNISDVAYNPWSDLRKRDDVKALGLDFPWEKIPVDFAKKITQSYYAAVTYVDDLIGILLKELQCSKFHDNTVVLLTSDHGWSLGEHGEWAKYSNFEVALRVPLIISVPRLEPRVAISNVGRTGFLYPLLGTQTKHDPDDATEKRQSMRRVVAFEEKSRLDHREDIKKIKFSVSKQKSNIIRLDALVELVDVFPTIAELAGHPIPICPDIDKNYNRVDNEFPLPNPCSEGISLMPLINAELDDERISCKEAAFSQYPRPGLEPSIKPNSDEPRFSDINIMGYTLRTKEYRYTLWLPFIQNTKKPDWSFIIAEELYDHSVDSGEISNISKDPMFADVKEKLARLLRRGWRSALPKRKNCKI